MESKTTNLDLTNVMAALVSDLIKAHATFSEDPKFCRAGAVAALGACLQFVIRTVPNGAHLMLPLRELLYEIHDLNAGYAGPILKPTKRNGGRPTSATTEVFRAMAAVLMDVNQLAGMGRNEAAERAAQTLKAEGYRDERVNLITPQRLEDWRDKVKEGGDGIGARRYQRSLDMLSETPPDNLEKFTRSLLDAMAATYPHRRIPNDPTP